jgi:maltooligosyltrehalose trehalohydrolase
MSIHGAITGDGHVTWSVWAPRARNVNLILKDGASRRSMSMQREPNGWFTHVGAVPSEQERYWYQLDGTNECPDPASRWQPEGVHQPSALFCPSAFAWTDGDWRGVARADLVIYELHVGTFTAEGTFDAIVPRLPQLREIGITAIELMPVAQFPGSRNWGYDGVHPFAVQNTYGGPRGLQRFVNACHAYGIAVLLDVVWNHQGPEGNYFSRFGPYFTEQFHTPWGAAINFAGQACEMVRELVLQNARYWLSDFHLDGLRVDAVHMIVDNGPCHILYDVREVADQVAAESGRRIHVIAECDLNHPSLEISQNVGDVDFSAIWNDDFHHSVHSILTGERHDYYADFGGLSHLTKAFNHGIVRDAWRNRDYRSPQCALTTSPCGSRYVVSIQNHDQVGNRPHGDRLSTLLSAAQQRLAAGLLLLSPYTPLLFMGEEYGEQRRFPFFCSFSDVAIAQSVQRGRAETLAESGWTLPGPDPQAEQTFAMAKLSWSWPVGSWHDGLRRWYRDLLAARRQWGALRNSHARSARSIGDVNDGIMEMTRGRIDDPASPPVLIYFNISSSIRCLPASASQRPLPAGFVLSSELPCYGGNRNPTSIRDVVTADCEWQLLPFEVLVFSVASLKDRATRRDCRGFDDIAPNIESPGVAAYNG